MLIEFKIANFRSIRDEETLSMLATKHSDELAQNLIPVDLPGIKKGTRLVKAVALYGANASGKSNVIAALRFFAEFIRDSATKLQPGALTGAEPFKLDPAYSEKPTKFEMTAVINDVRILYGLGMTCKRVTSEYLVAYPKGRPQVWFERDWNSSKRKYEWSRSTEHFRHDSALRDKVRENAAFVSVASQFAQTQAAEVSKWMNERILRLIGFDENFHFGIVSRYAVGVESLRKELIEAAQEADLGVDDVVGRKSEPQEVVRNVLRMRFREHVAKQFAQQELEKHSDTKSPLAETKWFKENYGDVPEGFNMPEILHRGKGGKHVGLAFDEEESIGTRRYLELSAQFSLAAAAGLVLVYDELDTSLHPLLVIRLLRRFFAKSKGTAQLIFTTHNPFLLEQTLLRRDQIWFTEKDQEGATRLYPLTDYAPRKDESLVKGYLAGRYGGIPFIPESLDIKRPAPNQADEKVKVAKRKRPQRRSKKKVTSARP